MNPFTLSGPDFLVEYVVILAAVTIGILVTRRRLGADGLPTKKLTDPYAIALVRGGRSEAIRIGVMGLVRRGLMTQAGRALQAVTGASGQVRDPAEKALLEACVHPREGHTLLDSRLLEVGFLQRVLLLEEAELVPDAALRGRHRWLVFGAAGILGFLGIGKVLYAVSHGHSNVVVLVFFIMATVGLFHWLYQTIPIATPRGRLLLTELRSLFGSLRGHSVAGRQDEALFLAAIFGVTALPAADQGVIRRAFEPRPPPADSSSSCGASSSSSCGSSSGSSCGGGGCGGCGS